MARSRRLPRAWAVFFTLVSTALLVLDDSKWRAVPAFIGSIAALVLIFQVRQARGDDDPVKLELNH